MSGLSDQYSRLGERGSPKRGRDEACENDSPKRGHDETLVLIYVESSSKRGVLCVERTQSRSGEQGSPKRGVVESQLVHTRSGEVV
ncbi:hypothetical protein DEO72_LG2g3794 [Vigna unguiculata]|uniref:Uncharacterized protein n=1 Tax=Vigna unguiculata TaxID=3917 RepID=A0A4D6L4P6_VIGUN|nr:hypothetical protein DEO72_LG2g3794 [Vigna unguiculata]